MQDIASLPVMRARAERAFDDIGLIFFGDRRERNNLPGFLFRILTKADVRVPTRSTRNSIRRLNAATSATRSRRRSVDSGSCASAPLTIRWPTCSAEFISVCTDREALKDTLVPSTAWLAIRTIAIRQNDI